ncbi:MAG TPA: glycerol-3-phosphate dehydrogenase/oxidase [Acidimicrobiales bacterium]|nr:glycerol-3-phosphate dehydrogenase/oxidase [Acidimicrobiales bacterium]
MLVIGGGITGAGVALDAASRGLRTALVERDDFGAGTSSKSSKLVHGGLRYLSQGDYGLVAQALAERQRLLHNAPHLVRPLPFLIPTYGSRTKSRAISAALWTYDLIGGFRIGSLHRRLSVADTLARAPALRSERLAGGLLYLDAYADDARLTLSVIRTAVLDHLAVAANHAGVRERLPGAGAVVEVGGRDIEVRASVVVNATGVWADTIAGGEPATIRPAKGVHVTVPAALVPTEVALVLPVPADGRSIFVVPWPGTDRVYIGTTDTDYGGPLDAPTCTAEDTAYLLDAVNASLRTTLSAGDVVGDWAGLRPLVAGAGSERSADLSRRHRVSRGADGTVTVAGGKLTTYRAMAADTVDEVQAALGRPGTPSRTAKLALRGAGAGDDHLASRYGTEARVLRAMIAGDPSLAEPLVPTLPYQRAEALYAARYEMAATVDDVLARRTRSLILARDASIDAAAGVAELIGPELGWTDADARAQVQAYRAGAEAG